MKYFKNRYNEIYAFDDDGSQDQLITADMVQLNEEDALAIANPPPSYEQMIIVANETKQKLLAEANNSAAPLQAAVDLDIATDSEVFLLNEWKKYCVLLNRIDTSTAPDIDWPGKPAVQ